MKRVDSFKSLNALLGVYGVKTSLLMSNQDYWTVAKALWDKIDEFKGATLDDLQKQIKAMKLKERRRQAINNAHRVPSHFFSTANKHQAKIREHHKRVQQAREKAQ